MTGRATAGLAQRADLPFGDAAHPVSARFDVVWPTTARASAPRSAASRSTATVTSSTMRSRPSPTTPSRCGRGTTAVGSPRSSSTFKGRSGLRRPRRRARRRQPGRARAGDGVARRRVDRAADPAGGRDRRSLRRHLLRGGIDPEPAGPASGSEERSSPSRPRAWRSPSGSRTGRGPPRPSSSRSCSCSARSSCPLFGVFVADYFVLGRRDHTEDDLFGPGRHAIRVGGRRRVGRRLHRLPVERPDGAGRLAERDAGGVPRLACTSRSRSRAQPRARACRASGPPWSSIWCSRGWGAG